MPAPGRGLRVRPQQSPAQAFVLAPDSTPRHTTLFSQAIPTIEEEPIALSRNLLASPDPSATRRRRKFEAKPVLGAMASPRKFLYHFAAKYEYAVSFHPPNLLGGPSRLTLSSDAALRHANGGSHTGARNGPHEPEIRSELANASIRLLGRRRSRHRRTRTREPPQSAEAGSVGEVTGEEVSCETGCQSGDRGE